MNSKIITAVLLTALCVLAAGAAGLAHAGGENVPDVDKLTLVLTNNEERVLDGCRIDGPYYCDKNGRFCIHENNIAALKGNSLRCWGTGIIGNLRLTKDLIQEVKDAAGISDWFRKACESGIKNLSSFSGDGKMIIDQDKLESIRLLKGDSPTKGEIGQGKTFTFSYEAKYSNNRQQQYNCRINTRAWIYYIYMYQ